MFRPLRGLIFKSIVGLVAISFLGSFFASKFDGVDPVLADLAIACAVGAAILFFANRRSLKIAIGVALGGGLVFFASSFLSSVGIGGGRALLAAGVAAIAIGGAAWLFFFWRRGGRGPEDSHLRGAEIADARTLNRMLLGSRSDFHFQIGGVKVPREMEVRGFLFCGAPGTGKSVAITSILDLLHERGDTAFISDRSGIYTSRYFDPSRGDVILNPFDARAVAWSPLSEMRAEHDAETLAKSLIPDAEPGSSDFQWNQYAQVFVEGVLLLCWREGRTNAEVARLVRRASLEELGQVLDGHAAAGLVTGDNAKMFGSVRGIAATCTSSLSRMRPDAGRDAFSIRSWVEKDNGGRIFWNFQSNQLRPARAMIGAQCDIFADALMSLPPSSTRRAWLVLDEFASIGKVGGMENFLTNSRKYGGSAILGMQAISQVHSLYGRNGATSMLSSISTRLALRAPDPETAEYLSRGMGERQVLRKLQSGGSAESLTGGSKHQNWAQQVAQERAVMPAEILRLRDLHGFLTLSGDLPHARVELSLPESRPDCAPAYVPLPPPAPGAADPQAAVASVDVPSSFDEFEFDDVFEL